jgi:hypothetical protein
MMTQPAVLEAENAIGARRAERVSDDVREARHRLRLCDEAVVRVVHTEPVIHVGARDTNLHQFARRHRGRGTRPTAH